jgi:hypothetical protein
VRWTDLTVRHTGYADRELRERKLDRDLRILTLELAGRPSDPFVLFNLGAIAVERHSWHEALEFLKKSLAGSAPTDSIVRKLYALIARAHQMIGNTETAIQTCLEGLTLDSGDRRPRGAGKPGTAETCIVEFHSMSGIACQVRPPSTSFCHSGHFYTRAAGCGNYW